MKEAYKLLNKKSSDLSATKLTPSCTTFDSTQVTRQNNQALT